MNKMVWKADKKAHRLKRYPMLAILISLLYLIPAIFALILSRLSLTYVIVIIIPLFILQLIIYRVVRRRKEHKKL